MMANSSLPPRTQSVLSLLPYKIPNPWQMISKHSSATAFALLFEKERVLVCDCYDYCSHLYE